MQTLQELITGVLAAVGQLQLFAVQGLISLGQTVRLLAYAEAGDPGAPCQVVQRVLHHHAALPLGLGQLPDVGDRGAVRICVSIVEQLGQLDVERGLGRGVLLVDMGQDVSRLIVVELAGGDILVVERTVLVLDMNNVGNVLACVVLTGDLLEQLVGGDVERLNLDAGVLLSEGLGYLGDTGRDRVNRYLALFLCLLVQLFVGLVGVEDAGGLLPVGQLQGACCCRCVRVLRALICIAAAAARRTAASACCHRKHHRCSQNTCQCALVL